MSNAGSISFESRQHPSAPFCVDRFPRETELFFVDVFLFHPTLRQHASRAKGMPQEIGNRVYLEEFLRRKISWISWLNPVETPCNLFRQREGNDVERTCHGANRVGKMWDIWGAKVSTKERKTADLSVPTIDHLANLITESKQNQLLCSL